MYRAPGLHRQATWLRSDAVRDGWRGARSRECASVAPVGRAAAAQSEGELAVPLRPRDRLAEGLGDVQGPGLNARASDAIHIARGSDERYVPHLAVMLH